MAAVDGGLGVYSAAPLFRVSVSYIYKALLRRRATGDVTAHKSGGGPKPRLAAYDEALRAQLARKGDITLIELQAWLAGDHAVKVSVGCLWARLRHLGLTLKTYGPPRSQGVLSRLAADPVCFNVSGLEELPLAMMEIRALRSS